MKITVTIGEIFDKGKWQQFCEMFGWNEWCVNEGRASTSEEVILSETEAKKLGFIKDDNNGF